MNVGSTIYLAKVVFRIYNQGVTDDGINPNASGLTASSPILVRYCPMLSIIRHCSVAVSTYKYLYVKVCRSIVPPSLRPVPFSLWERFKTAVIGLIGRRLF